MIEIKDIRTLKAEIFRLESEKLTQEQRIRKQFKVFRESIKPANLASSALKSILGDNKGEQNNGFVRNSIKKRLLLLIEKSLPKPGEKSEQQISGIVDMVFDRVKSYFQKSRQRKKEKSFYKFEDEYDSESN